jgi:hypothetical protein
VHPFPGRTNAAGDVVKVLLEHFDGEPEVVAHIVKTPLVFAEQVDDFLTSGLFRRHPEPLEDQTPSVQTLNVQRLNFKRPLPVST